MSKEQLSTSETQESGQIPKIKLALQEKYEKEAEKIKIKESLEPEALRPETMAQDTIDELPQPSGYRILVLPLHQKKKVKVEYYFPKKL